MHKADIMLFRLEADLPQGTDIQVQDIQRAGLQHHLELVIMLAAIGVLPVAAVLGPAARLDEGRIERLRTQRAQEGGRIEGGGAFLHVIRLREQAAAAAPIFLQG